MSEEKTTVQSIPDSPKRSYAHAGSMVLVFIGALLQAMQENQEHLLILFPQAKWLPSAIIAGGALWKILLNVKEASGQVSISVEKSQHENP